MESQNTFYKKCLEDELALRCEKNPRYSLRAFAKACHLSPGELSLILAGKRIPSFKVAQKILSGLNLSPQEQNMFLQSLAQKHQSRGLKRLGKAFKDITTATPLPRPINIDLFRIIGDWYHYAVLMLT